LHYDADAIPLVEVQHAFWWGPFINMSSSSAQTETIERLFAAYSKQGIKKDKAIKLIASSLGLPRKQVLETLQKPNGNDD
jgi:predicted DsbA family dithiol-disulfide isomerase